MYPIILFFFVCFIFSKKSTEFVNCWHFADQNFDNVFKKNPQTVISLNFCEDKYMLYFEINEANTPNTTTKQVAMVAKITRQIVG